MMDAIEKVARAMQAADGVRNAAAWEDESEGNRWDYLQMARAALKAIREPNDAMIAAGRATSHFPDRTFTAMIDAAIVDANAQAQTRR